jgi:hypothetical protein
MVGRCSLSHRFSWRSFGYRLLPVATWTCGACYTYFWRKLQTILDKVKAFDTDKAFWYPVNEGSPSPARCPLSLLWTYVNRKLCLTVVTRLLAGSCSDRPWLLDGDHAVDGYLHHAEEAQSPLLPESGRFQGLCDATGERVTDVRLFSPRYKSASLSPPHRATLRVSELGTQSDLFLISGNCKTYNPPASPYHTLAARMESLLESVLSAFEEELEGYQSTSSDIRDVGVGCIRVLLVYAARPSWRVEVR